MAVKARPAVKSMGAQRSSLPKKPTRGKSTRFNNKPTGMTASLASGLICRQNTMARSSQASGRRAPVAATAQSSRRRLMRRRRMAF